MNRGPSISLQPGPAAVMASRRASLPPLPEGYDFYVDHDAGDDAGDGSRETPWKTLSRVATYGTIRDLNPAPQSLTLSDASVGAGRTATLGTEAGSNSDWPAEAVGWTLELYGSHGPTEPESFGIAVITAIDGRDATVTIEKAAPATAFAASGEWKACEQADGADTSVYVRARHWKMITENGADSNERVMLDCGHQPSSPTSLTVILGAGSILDGEGTKGSGIGVANSSGQNFTLIVEGESDAEADWISTRNWTSTGNGVAGNGYGHVKVKNIISEDNIDGYSAHGFSRLTAENFIGRRNAKGQWVHIADSVCNGLNGRLYDVAGSTGGLVLYTGNATGTMTNMQYLPDPDNPTATAKVDGGHHVNCQIGDPANGTVELSNATAEDCYVKLNQDGDAPFELLRCFGLGEMRKRAGAQQIMRKCAFIGPASDRNSLLYRVADLGMNDFICKDSVVAGYTVGVGDGFSATYADEFVASDSEVVNCGFWQNTYDVNPNIVAASDAEPDPKPVRGTVTGDPQFAGLVANGGAYADLAGLRASTTQADYAVTAAAYLGAGSDGENIGFSLADLS